MTTNSNEKSLVAFLSETRSRIKVGSSIHELAKSTLGLMSQELGFIGGSIYFFNPDTQTLHHLLYESRKSSRLIHRLLDPQLNRLTCKLGTNPESGIEACINAKRRMISPSIEHVAQGFLPDSVLRSIQKSSRLHSLLLNPILQGNDVVGLLIVGHNKDFSQSDLQAIDIISEQLAQPFSSMIEQTRLLNQLGDSLTNTNLEPEKPTIKFTLRVTPSMHRELERCAAQKGISKADVMRHAAAEYLEQQNEPVELGSGLKDDSPQNDTPENVFV
ncbi:MAG: GAF domain-containing protein [Candidatus Doudnabacteria bacterium]|nr:GAF domain-containing protein [Candidatus Doudnabacteria bacterium]